MPQDAQIVRRLLRRIQARNKELLLELALEVMLGLLFTALTSGVVFAVAWYVAFSIGGRGFPASTAALGVTMLVFLVGLVSAWRNINPFAGLKPMSAGQSVAVAAGQMLDGYVHVNRHTIAGLATVLMGGPENLVAALRTWLHRLPADPALLNQAAAILTACRPDLDLRQIETSPQAVVLLRRLTLIVPRADSTWISLTEKGRDLVHKTKAAAEHRE